MTNYRKTQMSKFLQILEVLPTLYYSLFVALFFIWFSCGIIKRKIIC